MKPRGGTEIQYEYLKKHVQPELLNKVKITTSVPEKIPLSPDKPNILWMQDNYNQETLIRWFLNKENHTKYDWYVFNSHWTYEKYRDHFAIPAERSLVIKNGFDDELILRKDFTISDKIRMVYTSTPWRGLDILLDAMESVSDHIELDVYSSTEIYGKQFKTTHDAEYISLYEKAESLSNVNYCGYVSHEELCQKLHTYDVFVYPSIFEETFCIAALEALASGLTVLTTNYGALYETCAEFPIYVMYDSDKSRLAKQFTYAINDLPKSLLVSPEIKIFQQNYYQRYYHWDIIKEHWNNFLWEI